MAVIRRRPAKLIRFNNLAESDVAVAVPHSLHGNRRRRMDAEEAVRSFCGRGLFQIICFDEIAKRIGKKQNWE